MATTSKLKRDELRAFKLLGARDEAAISELQVRFGPWVHAMLKKSCSFLSDGDLKDIYVEALCTVWEKFPQYDQARGSLRTWIYGIARNRAIDRWRSDTRVERRIIERQEARGASEFQKYRSETLEVIDQFSERQRLILFADLQAWPWKINAQDLADRLGGTVASLYTQRHKAYRKLEGLTGRGRLRRSDV